MTTVNSLSGGKTSSYLAVHYPADIEIFALVCIDCHNARGVIDPAIKRFVNEKLQKTSSQWPEFRATAEDPKTLKVIMDLEQLIGREIIWVRGIGFEELIEKKKYLPNRRTRFCTHQMKMQPIFEYLYLRTELPVEMRIGFRYDELERQERFTTKYRAALRCDHQITETVDRWVNRWQEFEWRTGKFPLIEDRIMHPTVQRFWRDKPIVFPEDSNCQFCFWKHPQQKRKNFETNPAIMYWGAIHEDMIYSRLADDYSLLQISRLGLQQDFHYGTGTGCQADGFCTN